ncbi:MAG: efflux RND transporter periplasmic adaptor subunit [Proteobacteria bacterium]|nr:efflux RND transporter periplasmic adaptor subunit [Pseudomonadota bacterium]MBU4471298.1 efflux RND transporter periplasmic adaptor subunit [Pseudomonadota bacterium]MCG2751697.1 efflux RND transporter periplasmic adaptor subunit [Desulfobacteraceae bacterium]
MMDEMRLSAKETLENLDPPAGKRRLKLWVTGIILVVVAVVIVIFWNGRKTSGTPSFKTQPIVAGNLTITVTATGNLQATNQVEIGSELSGIITKMTADYNDTVKVNQPLVYLDDARYKAAVMKSRAQVASAKANQQEAMADRNAKEKTLKRLKLTHEITQGRIPSLEDLDQARAAFERSIATVGAAEATVLQAEAALTLDETDLKKTVIYSPINGIVLSRNAEPGQTVAASLQAPVLFTLAEDLRQMELQVDVDEADVGLVHEGQEAVFTVDAYSEKTFRAVIRQVRYGSETSENVVTYKTILEVENPDLLLRPGMTATADITVQKIENTLLVPNPALRFSPPTPAKERPANRSLISFMLPRPPRSQSSGRDSGEESGAKKDVSSRVWILKDHRPEPVAVEIEATDGAITAIKSPLLKKDMEVIVNALAAGK